MTEKLICRGLVALTLLLAVLLPTTARAEEIVIYVDGQTIAMDVPPLIIEGTTLVPLRAIFEGLGAEVAWDEESKTASGELAENKVTIGIGEAAGYRNGQALPLAQPAQIIAGRTLVPLRFIAESLDCQVDWDQESRAITIITQAFAETEEAALRLTYYDHLMAEDFTIPNLTQIIGTKAEIDGSELDLSAFVIPQAHDTQLYFYDAALIDSSADDTFLDQYVALLEEAGYVRLDYHGSFSNSYYVYVGRGEQSGVQLRFGRNSKISSGQTLVYLIFGVYDFARLDYYQIGPDKVRIPALSNLTQSSYLSNYDKQLNTSLYPNSFVYLYPVNSSLDERDLFRDYGAMIAAHNPEFLGRYEQSPQIRASVPQFTIATPTGNYNTLPGGKRWEQINYSTTGDTMKSYIGHSYHYTNEEEESQGISLSAGIINYIDQDYYGVHIMVSSEADGNIFYYGL